ncbi:YafY family protein [Chitinivorax sp. PXF-14]|uniref:helix-turn-helix transcriptional regulator n=1 Tax=Chitinivorax sp. PXF-14 TaxID=3230488 RepID=UPI0034673B39
MDRTERFYKIDQLLNDHRVVPVATFLDQLGISLATFKRDLDYLRDRLHAPIVWDREARGYRFERQHGGARYELPGLWFNAQEIHALLTMRQLLASLSPGLLSQHVEPLLARLQSVLAESHAPEEIDRRIRILRASARAMPYRQFELVATATLKRRRLALCYYNRSRDDDTERQVSPQRLVHYRDNWYLDAWCHLRGGLRSFALDAIRSASPSDEAALDIAEAELDRVLAAGYGIFGGAEVQWADLLFSAERARWVAAEHWHPGQQGAWQDDGRYRLRLPYSDDRELLMDILRYGADVEVLAPANLRQRLIDAVAAMQRVYGGEDC